MRQIEFIEVPSEIGAGTRGASLGIGALKVADQNKQKAFFANYSPKIVQVANEFLYSETDTPSALRIEGISKIYNRIATQIQKTVADNKFPFILSGDHSSAGGTIAGLKMAKPNNRLGAIWVDAHADLHSPFTTPSGNVHGMPLACSINDDNLECQINQPNEKSIAHWNEMKNLGDIAPKIAPTDIVFIALRDYEKPEADLIKKHGMKVITVAEVREKGIAQAVADSFAHLAACDDIYISYDVDSMDSKISAGTGTPVPNGLNEKELEELLTSLLKNEKINCFEVTEINPTLDTENKMAEVALAILEQCVQTLKA